MPKILLASPQIFLRVLQRGRDDDEEQAAMSSETLGDFGETIELISVAEILEVPPVIRVLANKKIRVKFIIKFICLIS